MSDGFGELDEAQVIDHLRQSIGAGRHWYLALLESMALWTMPEETFRDRHYYYLIAGQAFDWLLLAERLLAEIEDLVPPEERIDLLFGKPPMDLSREEFRELIGAEKYQAHLNYFYGVVVEQTLHLAVEMEIEKERLGAVRQKVPADGVFERIYGLPEAELLGRFSGEEGMDLGEQIPLDVYHRFVYWLFRYRVEHCDSSRLASDTKKALRQLDRLGPD